MNIVKFNFGDIKKFEDLVPLCKKISSDKKNKIVNFFDNLKPCAFSSCYIYDFFTNKEVDLPIVGYEIDSYEIDSREIYYFKNYDLKLNDDFIEYVLNKI